MNYHEATAASRHLARLAQPWRTKFPVRLALGFLGFFIGILFMLIVPFMEAGDCYKEGKLPWE